MKNARLAFSLIELMVVIAIIGILAVMGIANFQRAVIKARDAKRMSDLNNLQQALVMYRSDRGTYPCSNDVVTHVAGSSAGSTSTPSGNGLAGKLVPNYIREMVNPPMGSDSYVYTPASCSVATSNCGDSDCVVKTFTLCTALENQDNTALNACGLDGINTGSCTLTHYCVYSP